MRLPPEERAPNSDDLRAAAGRRIPDLVVPGLTVLFCGINPWLYSAAAQHHFARPGNRFWPALHLAGFTGALAGSARNRRAARGSYAQTVHNGSLYWESAPTARRFATREQRSVRSQTRRSVHVSGSYRARAARTEVIRSSISSASYAHSVRRSIDRDDLAVAAMHHSLGPRRSIVVAIPFVREATARKHAREDCVSSPRRRNG
ncbi:MAG: uracil-DNA glycosylase family protein [Gemmatimonadaceae bacterium]